MQVWTRSAWMRGEDFSDDLRFYPLAVSPTVDYQDLQAPGMMSALLMRFPSRLGAVLLLTLSAAVPGRAQQPARSILTSGWQMQDAAKVTQTGEQLSQASFAGQGWYRATVPGTVLTTLVDNKVYPDPMFGENNRPGTIPDSLCRTDWWYRTVFPVPTAYAGKRIWLNFDGINYAAQVWVNEKPVGTIKGAFIRGIFDLTALVQPGQQAAIAVRIAPPPHPGMPAEHTLGAGNGTLGGVTGLDGPTFVCTIGWDWLPGIRDRNTGLWQKVFLSATGPVVVKNPRITTDLPLPSTDSADITVQVTAENVTDQPQKGVLKGSFGGVVFEKSVELAARSSETVYFEPKKYPQLQVKSPRLWWPNGYGEPYLYSLHLSFDVDGRASDTRDVSFGIREFSYDAPGTDKLALSVNGVRVFCKGGNWGMDDALKRIPRERLEAQVRMHRDANLNMIRNWGGQSTSDDLYDLCDKYGILLWDEFFQLTENPLDYDLYMANCRDKVLRTRNHPSIAVWCGRNEATPLKYFNDALSGMLTELDGTRYYQPNSGDGRGVNSGGPYDWKTPGDYYHFSEKEDFNRNETFKTEIGAISIPTLESIQGMMPERDWNTINDDWAEHDFMAGSGRRYPQIVSERYGRIANLPDFVRKGQMMNYEGYRAMYEGRQAQMFHPVQGVLTWMSHPAQPSFVWQLYHYDLEPNAALFAVEKSSEPVHIQLNDVGDGTIQVVNNRPVALNGARAKIVLYNLDGSSPYQHEYDVNAAPSATTDVGKVEWSGNLSPAFFVKLELRDSSGKLLSGNFYWRGSAAKPNDLTALETLPVVTLAAKAERRDADGRIFLDVTLKNPASQVALMTHLQLHRGVAGERVLPAFYSDNYLSFAPGEEKTVTIEASAADLKGQKPAVLIDGWNIGVAPSSSAVVDIALNKNAQVDAWPRNGLPFGYAKLGPADEFHVNCGGFARDGFIGDPGHDDFGPGFTTDPVEVNVPHAAPEAIYRTVWWGRCAYPFYLKGALGQKYTVRLHFMELSENEPGKRVFDIHLNGKPAITDLDVFKEAGGKFKALVKDLKGATADEKGMITVELPGGKIGTPQISGIEILKE